ncbi:MAG: VOC family protein [Verrucomicrobiota bacterium]
MSQNGTLAALQLDTRDPEASIAFYSTVLGMRLLRGPGLSNRQRPTNHSLGFAQGATLQLRHRPWLTSARYRTEETDSYWKIGITVPDVDLARTRLVAHGVEVTEPTQFHEIGYLCHLEDPDGYTIELLQHRFADNQVPIPPQAQWALGSEPTLGQVSLNVSDIEASLAFFCDRIGMRLLSRQRVPGRGFTLYFLAATDEALPEANVTSVSNREWLWQRPYTTLELRAFDSAHSFTAHPAEEAIGFRGLTLPGDEAGTLFDPDGVRIRLEGPEF